ncbi:MAG TPA: hypothetical protein VE593_09930 [Nitrososphaeraceae archaeon]|nr:hypothetical protein [Nitrososphaeraceae archaeon]
MSDEIQKQATEGITFRIPSSSIHQLREESKKKQVSLNTLVNQILKDHLDWHTYAAQARMFHVPRSTFSSLVDNLTEEELSKFAVTIAKKEFVDIGLLLRGEFTLPSFLNILENWSRMSSIPYKHETNNDIHNFILQHDMGRNYSFFVKEIFQYIFQEIFKIRLDFTITDKTVRFKFRES